MSKLPGAMAGFGLGAISVGGALSADFASLEPYRGWLEPVALGLLGLGVAALPAAGLAYMATRSSVASAATRLIRREMLLDDRLANEDDLETIVKLGRKAIGDAHPGVDVLRARMKRNSQIIRVVFDSEATSPRVLGYTILYPLSKPFSSSILSGERVGIKNLPVSDIAETIDEAGGLYVSMIYGSTLASKAAAIALLRGQIRRALLQNRDIKLVFGRPATSHGLRLLRQYGFSPLTAEENIWASDEDRLEAQRREILPA
ncbi:MAG: hypothetical protein AAFO88_07135 [Pseudomonadota bacterium]